ncbi:piggyBac transposable element-derived protein 4-like [Ruditapes philippinarum]|uniref:piggyBac transposable element-derived protein 4-like n=1 Tax=Ruditapes philippinarum TaxID=129788 RepID=UPI00295BB400|nr:piggyBac transposable element-derived protein 4-like [Ruditapes philippinarum]
MAMGLVRKSDIAQYWSTKECVNTSFFGKYMTRNRFHLILSNLHIVDNNLAVPEGQPGFDKLFKVRPFIQMLHKNFLKYEPERDINFVEGLCPFKGRVHYRVYNPMKPNQFGIKLYQVCEAKSGYTIGFDVYHGDRDVIQYTEALEDEDTQGSYIDLSTTTKIVIGMLAFCGLLSKGYHIYMDNNYTSPELMEELDLLNTYACGTLRINRKGVPKAIQSVRNLRQGEAIFRRRGNMLVLKYHDKKDVNMLTTIHTANLAVLERVNRQTHEPITKPTPIVEYCKKMGGVDLSDQVVQYYEVLQKSMKWWRKLFLHMFNLMIVNSFILYKIYSEDEKKKTHHDFRAEIIASLIQTAPNAPRPKSGGRQTLEPIDRLTGRHFSCAIEPKPGAKKQAPTRPCVVCNVDRTEGSRKRKETTFQCKQCHKALCVRNCFERYHTVKNYRAQNDQ